MNMYELLIITKVPLSDTGDGFRVVDIEALVSAFGLPPSWKSYGVRTQKVQL